MPRISLSWGFLLIFFCPKCSSAMPTPSLHSNLFLDISLSRSPTLSTQYKTASLLTSKISSTTLLVLILCTAVPHCSISFTYQFPYCLLSISACSTSFIKARIFALSTNVSLMLRNVWHRECILSE